ncbi:PLP-dependent aminotransferase family protein [Paenibacillus chartarius]|uniref:PLP-dependent aminotransferase family protein n=1 Tax=Paenibacillus chartarius TaxID=747481 RepID=A0ABV6DGN2_9BACL
MNVQIPYHSYVELYPTKLLALYHALRDSVVDGRFGAASRLPSTRELAKMYGLSRGTVSQAYEMLAAEGYLSSEKGSGTYVAYRDEAGAEGSGASRERAYGAAVGKLGPGDSPVRAAAGDETNGNGFAATNGGADGGRDEAVYARSAESLAGRVDRNAGGLGYGFAVQEEGPGMADDKRGVRLSAWGQRVAALPALRMPAAAPGGVDFGRFVPDVTGFPREAWRRCLYAEARELSGLAGGGERAEPLGSPELRAAIARYLRRARGIRALPEHVAVTGGSMQALALVAQLLLGPEETAVAELPAFRGVRQAVRASGARCIDAPVDAQGIVPADWDARLLFVTPARQFPTGAVLSLSRRQQLLRWADEREAVIVEDDYDSEFRHRGKSFEPLKVLDRSERVVYVGSFTKTLLPGTRIGYAVLPPSLAAPFARAQQLIAGPYPVNLLEQRALAAFMDAGEYERHLRRMKRIYSRKFHVLAQLLQARLSTWFDWVESDAGLHLFGWWRGDEASYLAYRERCRSAGIGWAEAEMDTEALQKLYHDPHNQETSRNPHQKHNQESTQDPHGKHDQETGRDPHKMPPEQLQPASPQTSLQPPHLRRRGIYLNFAHLCEDELRRGVELMARCADPANLI